MSFPFFTDKKAQKKCYWANMARTQIYRAAGIMMRCPSFFLNESKLIHHRIFLLSIKMQMQVNTIQSTCLFVLKVTQIIVLQTSSSSENLKVSITQECSVVVFFCSSHKLVFLHNVLIFIRKCWVLTQNHFV